MKKIIIYLAVSFLIIIILAFYFISNNERLINENCIEACFNAELACPSLIDKEVCEKRCLDFDEKTIDYLKNIDSCEELSEKSVLIFQMIVPDNDNSVN
jgi:hypothetical protein